jgi:transposase-like protein
MGVPPLSEDVKAEAVNALNAAGGNKREAARQLGIAESTFRNRIKVAMPDGQKLKGTSTLYDKNGNERMTWVKTTADIERQREMMREAIASLSNDVKPLPPMKNKPEVITDLLSLYTITDLHLGMFAHKEEGGADWNLEIAKDLLNRWVDKAVAEAEPSEQAILLNLGDLLHQDGIMPVTPTSRHVLDSSSRFFKIADVAVVLIKRMISRMLTKHKRVHIIMADANHDPTSAIWLRLLFKNLYSEEPRVTIDLTEHPYYCFEWGNTSIFAHHGDKRNLGSVGKVFASQYREVFGRTKYSYGHLGHFHSAKSDDDGLMNIQVHPTLAARDSYASRNGYMAQRMSKIITYSKKYGYKKEFIITPEML